MPFHSVPHGRRTACTFLVFTGLLLILPGVALAKPDRALIVIGPNDHGPGTHEPAAGGRLIAYCLQNLENLPAIPADVVTAWPTDASQLDRYATVIFLGDFFPGARMPESKIILEQLGAMARRGCGVVCIHFGTGLGRQHVGPDGEHPLRHWIGGYFAAGCEHHQSVARIYEAALIEAPDPSHPLARGWSAFKIHDEPYTKNYFGPEGALLPGAFAAAVSMLPPDAPRRETVAWGIERPDRGRGFGVTLPHFFRSWRIEELRRFILNGIVWTAGREVPREGVRTTLPDLQQFNPESIEPVPRKR